MTGKVCRSTEVEQLFFAQRPVIGKPKAGRKGQVGQNDVEKQQQTATNCDIAGSF